MDIEKPLDIQNKLGIPVRSENGLWIIGEKKIDTNYRNPETEIVFGKMRYMPPQKFDFIG